MDTQQAWTLLIPRNLTTQAQACLGSPVPTHCSACSGSYVSELQCGSSGQCRRTSRPAVTPAAARRCSRLSSDTSRSSRAARRACCCHGALRHSYCCSWGSVSGCSMCSTSCTAQRGTVWHMPCHTPSGNCALACHIMTGNSLPVSRCVAAGLAATVLAAARSPHPARAERRTAGLSRAPAAPAAPRLPPWLRPGLLLGLKSGCGALKRGGSAHEQTIMPRPRTKNSGGTAGMAAVTIGDRVDTLHEELMNTATIQPRCRSPFHLHLSRL